MGIQKLLDGTNSKEIDLRNRKIVNASDGTNDTDYATIRQVKGIKAQKVHFFCFILGGLHVGNDLANRVYIGDNYSLRQINVSLKTPPVGSPVSINIKQGNNIIEAVSIVGSSFRASSNKSLKMGFEIIIDVTQVGSSITGSDLAIALVCE